MSTLMQIQDEEQKLKMTPMIDVTFLLLIFFMCTIKFKTLEGRLSAYLPRDVGVNPAHNEPIERLVIEVELVEAGVKVHPNDPTRAFSDASGERFSMRGRRVRYRVGPHAVPTLRALESRLAQAFEAEPTRPVSLRIATGAEAYVDVVGALDAAIAAGFTDVTFAAGPASSE